MTHPYASAAYAEVFRDMAQPLWVPAWGTHVLTRDLPGGGAIDAIGIYPLTVLGPGADLAAGLDWMKEQGLVSVCIVPDPATAPHLSEMQKAFGLCAPFKAHLVVDYTRKVRPSKHHRYEVKRAKRAVSVEVVSLADHLGTWCDLYENLVERHAIKGMGAFSRAAFERLLKVEGLTTVAAAIDGVIVSMHLWVADPASRSCYSLLAASSAEGYRHSASYAIYDASIGLFSDMNMLNLGGGAGIGSHDGGLIGFKKGFANGQVQAYLCGAILDMDRYAAASGGSVDHALPFPAYRFGERSATSRNNSPTSQ